MSTMNIESETTPLVKPQRKQSRKPSLFEKPVRKRATEDSNRSSTADHVDPLSLTFRDLRYIVDIKNDETKKMEQKEILKGISGHIAAGDMVALMGPSGAGKSTLLDLLAGRKTVGYIVGDLLFNGKPRSEATLRNSAYVLQSDVHLPNLSVKETLQFAAQFRMPDKIRAYQMEDRIEALLETLEMKHIEDSIVGGDTIAGISGGQRKRLSIGVEIINLPALIFLDEPTTGLDSEIAFDVMYVVQKLSEEGRTTVTTIHQPSEEIFALFNKLMLLDQGNVIYFGPTSEMFTYFTTPPYKFIRPKAINPANFALRTTMQKAQWADGPPPTGAQLAKMYLDSPLYARNRKEMESHCQTTSSYQGKPVPAKEYNQRQEVVLSATKQYRTLVHRLLIISARSTSHRLLIKKSFFAAVVLGSVYWDLDTDFSGAKSRLALLFVTVFFMMQSMVQAVSELIEFRNLFYRERAASCYTTFAYFSTLSALQLPPLIIASLAYSIPLYFMAGFKDEGDAFCYFLLDVFLTLCFGLLLSMLLAGACPDLTSALAVYPAFSMAALLFTGFMITVEETPDWWIWMCYITGTRWAFEGFVINEIDNQGCWEDERIGKTCISGINDSEGLLDNYGFDDFDKMNCLLILAGICVFLWIACYYVMRFVNWERK
eukprot:Rmarinus@m.4582